MEPAATAEIIELGILHPSLLGRAATADRAGRIELYSARLQGFAQKALHLGVDRAQIGRRESFHRVPQCRVDP